ncbi:unnamed protein product [Trypanosoma congolense IL3000]|uniref:WGS project CAEQ00000000 data, annotated contig 2003 n=1 Tax=Trypanosoma congolense (strain IL3000) TaxID=1068625 RepID=F9WAP8_TRYCI|nr:unnamed protein product [Trypanosoma congolense IL3000]
MLLALKVLSDTRRGIFLLLAIVHHAGAEPVADEPAETFRDLSGEAINATCRFLQCLKEATKKSKELSQVARDNYRKVKELRLRTAEATKRIVVGFLRQSRAASGKCRTALDIGRKKIAAQAANSAEEVVTKAEVRALLAKKNAERTTAHLLRFSHFILSHFMSAPVFAEKERHGSQEKEDSDAVGECPRVSVGNISTQTLRVYVEEMAAHLAGSIGVPRLDVIDRFVSSFDHLESAVEVTVQAKEVAENTASDILAVASQDSSDPTGEGKASLDPMPQEGVGPFGDASGKCVSGTTPLGGRLVHSLLELVVGCGLAL